MAHLDYKVEAWCRVEIPDEIVDEVIERLQNGATIEEISNDFDTDQWQYLHNTEEQLPVGEDGKATVEVEDDQGKETYWANGWYHKYDYDTNKWLKIIP